jgi:cell cycle checkpoint protein
VGTAHGDVRSALNALEFACAPAAGTGVGAGKGKGGRRAKKGAGGARAMLEAVTRREQSLVLFHLLGKILYNKRARPRVRVFRFDG